MIMALSTKEYPMVSSLIRQECSLIITMTFLKENFPALTALATSFFILINTNLYAQTREREQIVRYTVNNPLPVKRGETFKIDIVFRIVPGWYIYAPTGVNAAQGMIETNVIYRLPEGLSRAGRPELPTPMFKNGHEVYEGDGVVMTQTFKASADLKPGTYTIKGKITWQTCNNNICLPPVSEEIVSEIQVGE
jgi:DsbC/DsbD-like thiol-disulfide interchange protein